MRYTATSERRIAILPIGYGDGFPRVRNEGCALIHGRRAPLLGGIAMDALMVDITDIPQAQMWDEAVIMGRQGGEGDHRARHREAEKFRDLRRADKLAAALAEKIGEWKIEMNACAMMNRNVFSAIAKACEIFVCFGLMFLCSCATEKSSQPVASVTASMNTLAGRDDLLFIKLRSENGKDLFFAVDTGSPYTILDVSLEPELGEKNRNSLVALWLVFKCFLRTNTNLPDYNRATRGLLLGDSVATDNVNEKLLGRHVAGILGMDCLRHYCVSVRFEAKKSLFSRSKKFHR